MATIPTFAEEDAKRPYRERETLVGLARSGSFEVNLGVVAEMR
jgi:hypothetical protein